MPPSGSVQALPAGSVAAAMAKYAVSCGLVLTLGNVDARSGCVMRATIGGMNQTIGPMTNRIAASSAALRACCESLTLR